MADYGGYFGSTQFEFRITGPGGGDVLILREANHDKYELNTEQKHLIALYSIPTGLSSGVYKAVVTATVHNGLQRKAECFFNVE